MRSVHVGLVLHRADSAEQALKSIAPLLFIVVITALLNIFFVQGGDVYVQAGIIQISQLGVHNAVFIGIRLVLFLLGTSLLTLTTTTLDITDAFEHILNPLRRIGFPAHEFAMIMGIALRFLPSSSSNGALSATRSFPAAPHSPAIRSTEVYRP